VATNEIEEVEELTSDAFETLEEMMDTTVSEDSDLTVLRAITEYKREATDAKDSRMKQDRKNWDMYLNRQDFSDKQEGQSQESLPKTTMAVEQIAAFVRKALTNFGDWFKMEYKGEVAGIKSSDLTSYMKWYLEEKLDFPHFVSDAIKTGLLKSLLIAKVYGREVPEVSYEAVEGEMGMELAEITNTKYEIAVDLVDPKNYYPDPTGAGLYEIHETHKDYHLAVEGAKNGDYSLAAVESIEEDYKVTEKEWEDAKQKNQDYSNPPSFRKKIQLDELWGTILNDDGTIASRNVRATMANGKYLIKEPENNPRWDGESPFVVTPLVRVPFSVWHRAFFDHVVDLNIAVNELFNLMLDGGMASVWGINALDVDALSDPGQVSNGIPQGTTLLVKSGGAADLDNVFKQVSKGTAPRDAIMMYDILDREYQSASLLNSFRFGLIPGKEVKATEVLEASQSASNYFESMVAEVEGNFIKNLIRKIWVSMLQASDDFTVPELKKHMSEEGAMALASMSPEERFASLMPESDVKVFGLTAVLARAKEFQKMMALLQLVSTNPLLSEPFLAKFSMEKVLDQIMKSLNVNPDSISLGEEEIMMNKLKTLFQGGGGGAPGGAPVGATNNESKAANAVVDKSSGTDSAAEIARAVQAQGKFGER
jgi:hypothetical protein